MALTVGMKITATVRQTKILMVVHVIDVLQDFTPSQHVQKIAIVLNKVEQLYYFMRPLLIF